MHEYDFQGKLVVITRRFKNIPPGTYTLELSANEKKHPPSQRMYTLSNNSLSGYVLFAGTLLNIERRMYPGLSVICQSPVPF